MAKAIINLQKESGGIVKISPVDGIGVTEVTVPESGELATKEYVDTGAGVPFVANDNRVKTALNASGEAPVYACRAWVSFGGIGTVGIRASGNFSSITDNGIGRYTANFITAMPDANYSANVSGQRAESSQSIGLIGFYAQTESSVSVVTTDAGGISLDYYRVNISIKR